MDSRNYGSRLFCIPSIRSGTSLHILIWSTNNDVINSIKQGSPAARQLSGTWMKFCKRRKIHKISYSARTAGHIARLLLLIRSGYFRPRDQSGSDGFSKQTFPVRRMRMLILRDIWRLRKTRAASVSDAAHGKLFTKVLAFWYNR